MIVTTWRLDMRLKSRTMLQQYMDFKSIDTVRDLARLARVSHSTVGHLHSGARNSCRPETAKAIEEALGAPPGLLFEAVSSKVSREARPRRADGRAA